MRDITVILPTKDEEECVGKMIEDIKEIDELMIRERDVHIKIIVVDDSAGIETKNAVRRAKDKFSADVEFLQGVGNESPSIRFALEKCKTEFVIIVDSDGSQDVGIIPHMITCMDAKYDLVVGSRYNDGGDKGSTNGFSNLGNIWARFVLGLKTKDLTGRYFMSRKDLLLSASKWNGRGENSIDVIHWFEKRKYLVVEVPFVYKPRIGGKSKTNIPRYLKTYFKKVVGIRWNSLKLFSQEYISRSFKEDWTGEGEQEELPGWKRKVVSVIDQWQIIPYLVSVPAFKIPILASFSEMWVRNWGRSVFGFFIRACYYRTQLGFMGKDVFIDSGVLFFGAGKIFIDDGSFIDKDASLECAEGFIRTGKCVHIGAGSYINGKPFVEIGDYSCVDVGTKVFGSSNRHVDDKGVRKSMSCAAPYSMQHVIKKGIRMGRFSFLGPNSTLVGANIGSWTIVGANSFVKSDLPDNCIAAGTPAKVIGGNDQLSCLEEQGFMGADANREPRD